MAMFLFGTGDRSQALAKMVAKYNPEARCVYVPGETGEDRISRVEAPSLTMTRRMVSDAFFDGHPQFPESVDKYLEHYALTGEGKVLENSRDRVILCDTDADKMMSLRMKAYHQADIARLSQRLGISRNDFVLKAIDRYVEYLNDLEEMEE